MGSNSSVKQAWLQYVESDANEARNYVDPKYYAFFLHTLPPRSGLAHSAKVGETQRFGRHSATLDIAIGDFETWIALKEENGKWQLTLDENEILEFKTKNWLKNKFGKIEYVTSKPLSDEQKSAALEFAKSAEALEHKLGISIPSTRYYVAATPQEAQSIVGQKQEHAGRGRYRSIKTFNRFDHLHEYVHVLAMEIGMVNPFFDEGLASAFEEGVRFKKRSDCEAALSKIDSVFLSLLDGAAFNQSKLNTYGIAQATMRFWLKKFGIEKIKSVLRQSTKNPERFRTIIEAELGSLSSAQAATKEELEKICRQLP